MHFSTREAFELSLLLETHDIDPLTAYCRGCGQAEGHILAHRLECFRAPNIVAFSHRRAAQRLEQSVEQARRLRKSMQRRQTTDDWDEALLRIQFTDIQDPSKWVDDRVIEGSGNVFADLDLPEAARALDEFRRFGSKDFARLRAEIMAGFDDNPDLPA